MLQTNSTIADLDLKHYTGESFELDRFRSYPVDDHFKPNGLWVSVSGLHDWKSWCSDPTNEFYLEDLAVESTVILAPVANILYLSTAGQLEDFTIEYCVANEINWTLVVAEYDGIIIAPYQWGKAFSLRWYYGWDCASGCIWNLDAIEYLR